MRLLLGDLRQGALAGVMTDAVARAARLPPTELRRALTLHGDLAAVAAIALRDGRDGLAGIRLRVGRPLAPMLAGTAPDVEAAVDRKSTRLNSSHQIISYAVFCLKKKKKKHNKTSTPQNYNKTHLTYS